MEFDNPKRRHILIRKAAQSSDNSVTASSPDTNEAHNCVTDVADVAGDANEEPSVMESPLCSGTDVADVAGDAEMRTHSDEGDVYVEV